MEKQTAEINAELLDLWYTLTETMSDIQNMRWMVSEIQELGEMAVAANEIFLNYTRQEQEERVLLRCHRRIEQEYMEESKEEEKDEANSVNLETLRYNLSKKNCYTFSLFVVKKPTSSEVEESRNVCM